MNAASPRQSLVKGERLTRYELAAVMAVQGAGATARRWSVRRAKAGSGPRKAGTRRRLWTVPFSLAPAPRFGWPPRVRRRPLSEIALWITGSPASWRVSQTPECNGLLTATRGVYMITPQRQPGKFIRTGAGRWARPRSQLRAKAGAETREGRDAGAAAPPIAGVGCPRTGAKNCVEEPKFNDDGNWW